MSNTTRPNNRHTTTKPPRLGARDTTPSPALVAYTLRREARARFEYAARKYAEALARPL